MRIRIPNPACMPRIVVNVWLNYIGPCCLQRNPVVKAVGLKQRLNDLLRTRLSLRRLIWILPTPSPVNKLDRRPVVLWIRIHIGRLDPDPGWKE